jgi:hypothetical protein
MKCTGRVVLESLLLLLLLLLPLLNDAFLFSLAPSKLA